MSLIPLALDIGAVCCFAAFLMHRYGNFRKQHPVVTFAAFIAWYFSFLIIALLPLDVSSTYYRQCVNSAASLSLTGTTVPMNSSLTTDSQALESFPNQTERTLIVSSTINPALSCSKPISYVPQNILLNLWRVVYWTSQILTWLILPMMQSYANAGDFTVAGKIKSSLIENAIYYGSYLLIFGVCLIYVALKPNLHFTGSQLKVLAITASNTWGLFLLVLLLGYGLVDIPRMLWNSSKRGHMLAVTYFKIAKLSTEKSEAEENLEDVLDDVKKAAETIKYNHGLRKHVESILLKCPEAVQNSVKRGMDDYEDYNNPTETPTEKSLIRLHKNVIKSSQNYRRTQCQWNMLMEKAFELEDIALNEVSPHHNYIRSFGRYEGFFTRCYNPTIEWYWKCLIRPWSLRVIAILLAIFSFMVVWSECLFFVTSPTLSFFALFIEQAIKGDNYHYFAIELVSFLTILFLAWAAFYTVFKVRVFNYYYLAPHHQTDENSLIFCGILLCRLTPPLCLNFLGLIHLDSHVTKQYNWTETAYTEIMGHMDVIEFISNGFNIYFPIAIVLLCIATYFRLGSRILTFFGFQQFIGDDNMTSELTDEGKELVKRERRKRQRQEDSQMRRRNWAERFNDSTDYGSRQHEERETRRKQQGTTQPRKKIDKRELLEDAEPVDYNPESQPDYVVNSSAWEPSSRYQATESARPSRFSSSQNSGPPRGIFDDV